jgi:hypothetical protein
MRGRERGRKTSLKTKRPRMITGAAPMMPAMLSASQQTGLFLAQLFRELGSKIDHVRDLIGSEAVCILADAKLD